MIGRAELDKELYYLCDFTYNQFWINNAQNCRDSQIDI